MTVEEIRKNLLKGLKTVAESHGVLVSGGGFVVDPMLYSAKVSTSQGMLTTAKAMCRLAGIAEEVIHTVVEIGVASHQNAER